MKTIGHTDEKFITIAILHSRKKPAPVHLFVRREQIVVVRWGTIYAGMDAMCVRRPNPESCPAVDEIRAHRRLLVNGIE